MKAPRSQHEAIVVPMGGPVYQGQAGQTRTERVHLVEPDGTVRSVEVHRVVNVGTHPDLKARVLAGQLHHLEDGRELALAFVYHDPNARKFALVIPPALAHLEMKEWARLMTEVAEDTSAPVPGYVRDGTTVLGLGALELFLESGIEPDDAELHEVVAAKSRVRAGELHAQKTELDERERRLGQREREMAEQEESLVRLAADLTGRERSLERREQTLSGERAVLETREKDLAQREARAAELTRVAEQKTARVESWRPDRQRGARVVEAQGLEEATVVADMAQVAGAPLAVEDSELREVSAALSALAPPPLHRRAATPPPLAARISRPPPLHPERGPSRAERRSAAPPPLHPEREAAPIRPSPTGPPPPPAPPVELETLPALGMLVQETADELWLCLALAESHPDAFDHDADLLLQLVEVEGYPVVVLSCVGARQQIARLPLDGEAPATRRLLAKLEQSFRFQMAFYLGGQLRAVRVVPAPRESNARAVLAHLGGSRQQPRISFATARKQLLREPPPVRDETMPFLPSKAQPATTSSVLAALQLLERWTEPDMLEQALLLYSVPQYALDAGVRRLLRAALGFGVALPQRLLELAVTHKLGADRGQVVIEQLAAFRQRIERGQNDLDVVATLRNWERLFAQADELDLELEPSLRPWLERAARESGAPPPELPLSSAELRRDLGDPGRRLEAVRELCRRGHPSAIAPICGVLDELSPDEVAAAVVSLLGFGAAAGDGLVSALASPSQFVRHACALGLGTLRLPQTVSALIAQLEVEPTPSWAELARALGDFGAPALPVVARALGTSDRRERLMVALAHLANHGCGADVKSMESDPDPTLAMAARQALTRCARMEWDDQAIRNQQPLRDNSPEARFSQVFHSALAGAPPT